MPPNDPSTGNDHGRHHLNVHNVGKLTRLLKVEETLPFNHLTCDLVGDLKYMMKKYINVTIMGVIDINLLINILVV